MNWSERRNSTWVPEASLMLITDKGLLKRDGVNKSCMKTAARLSSNHMVVVRPVARMQLTVFQYSTQDAIGVATKIAILLLAHQICGAYS